MPFIPAAAARRHDLEDVRFTALAAPSRGARENAVWIVTLAPGAEGAPHMVTREETFVAIAGTARATIGGETHDVTAGSALVVPPGVPFTLANPFPQPFEAVAVMPVGGQAQLGDAPPFTPPWTV